MCVFRMNVLLTRARRGVLVVGHEPTLREDEVWADWLQWVLAELDAGVELVC